MMAKKNESPTTGATVAPESVLTEATGNSTTAVETSTAAPVAAQGADSAQAKTLPAADPTVEPDDTDNAAAGSWDDLETGGEEPRLMRVAYKQGIYLRIGPGKNFAHRRVLPFGTVVLPALVPDYAKVPGWLCVGMDSGDGETFIYGWVDETLVEDVKA